MSRNLSLLVALNLLSGVLLAQTVELPITHDNWKWLSPMPFGGNFSCVEYASENNLLAGGYNGYGLIFYSRDGGSTWLEANVPAEVTQTVTKIRMFSDGLTGYAMAGDHLLKTVDGGMNWEIHVFENTKFFHTPDHYDQYEVYSDYENFERHNNGILHAWKLVSWEAGNHGRISFNDGKTWNLIGDSITNTEYEKIDQFFDMFFLDSLNGWGIATDVQTISIYHTRDKGKSWQKKTDYTRLTHQTLYFKSPDEGYLMESVSDLDTTYISLKYTNNGGATWNPRATFPYGSGYYQYYKLAFFNDSIGFFSNNLQVYKTEDNGQSWTMIDSVASISSYSYGSLSYENLHGIDFDILEDSTILIKRKNNIYYSDDLGESWSQPASVNFPGDLYDDTPNVGKLKFATPDYCIFASGNRLVSFDAGKTFSPIESYLVPSVHLIPMPDYSFSTDRYRHYFNIDTLSTPAYKLMDISYGVSDSVYSEYEYYGFLDENREEMYFLFRRDPDYVNESGSAIMKQVVHSDKLKQYNYPLLPYGSQLDFPLMAEYNIVYRLPQRGLYNEQESFNQEVMSLDKNHAGFGGQFAWIRDNDMGILNTAPGAVKGHATRNGILWSVGEGIYRMKMGMNSWENLGSPGSILNGVQFESATNGAVVGNNIEIYTTINSGDFWTKSYKPELKVAGVTGAYFTNDYTGYLISSNLLFSTQDGGFTWNIAASSSFGENNKLFVQPDNSFAYVLSKAGTIHKVNLETAGVNSLTAGANDFYFLDNNNGYYITDQDFYRTEDGGDTWIKVYTFYNVKLNAVSFSDLMNGYAGGDLGKLYKTTNGGITWNDISVAGQNINGLSVVSSDTVFVGADKGQFFYSYDGGITFTPRSVGTGDNIHHIRFFNSNEGYIVISQGYIKITKDNFQLYQAPIKNNDPKNFERFAVGHERKSPSLFVINRTFNDFIYANGINVLRNPDYVPYSGGEVPGDGTGTGGTGDGDGGTGGDTGGSDPDVVTSVPDDQSTDLKISVYPNPNAGKFTLAISTPSSGKSSLDLKFYNSIGALVYGESMYLAKDLRTSIDISQLKPGVYTLVMQIDGVNHVRRIFIK